MIQRYTASFVNAYIRPLIGCLALWREGGISPSEAVFHGDIWRQNGRDQKLATHRQKDGKTAEDSRGATAHD